jgi:carbon monoxide dehydrogenase subunit G
MPTVMRFDDPMLVAQLGSQASQYAVNQDQQRQALAVQQQAAANAHAQGELELRQRQQKLAEDLAHPQQQMITLPGIEQHGQSGTTYNPDVQIPVSAMGGYAQAAQALDGVPDGRSGFGRGGAGMGYVHPQQKMMIAQVDQMEAAGHLQPAEAARWRMIIQTGGNPFTEKTASEVISEKGRSDALTAYQQAQVASRDRTAGDKEAAEAKKEQRQTILDQVKIWNDVLKSAAGDPDLTNEAKTQIKQLTDQLTGKAKAPPQAAPATQPAAGAAAGAPAQAAAAPLPKKAAVEITKLTPELSDALVRGYGSAAAARQAIAKYGSAQKALDALAGPTTRPAA